MFIQVTWTRKYSKYGRELHVVSLLVAQDLNVYVSALISLCGTQREKKGQ